MGYKFLYISLPSSVQQQRETTTFFWGVRTTAANFLYFHLELNAGIMYSAWTNSETTRHTYSEQISKIKR